MTVRCYHFMNPKRSPGFITNASPPAHTIEIVNYSQNVWCWIAVIGVNRLDLETFQTA